MSLEYNKTIKAYFRLGTACKALKRYTEAVKALGAALKLDASDPNGIKAELANCEKLMNN